MDVLNLPIGQLHSDPNNARTHDPRNIAAIKGSLVKFGQQKPIVIDEKNIVIAGNGTLQSARELEWTEIACVRTTLDAFKATAFAIADNRTAELASWDEQILGDTLKQLNDMDFDVTSIGFDLDEFNSELPTEGLTDDDDVPEVEGNEFGVAVGDVWKLGDHRLMCGDSTSKDNVELLMAGEKADMVFTDPPYGMFLDTNYDSMFSADSSHRNTGERFDKVIGDHEDFNKKFITNIFDCFCYVKEIFLWGADYYSEYLTDKNLGSWVVWDKRCSEQMDKVTGNTFELCFSKAKHKRLICRQMWSGHHGMQADDTKKRVHPTQKPTKLAEWFFDNWGKETKTVVDLFLGSGTTLIAAEKTNRKCYGMELDPHYCSVIIKRWQDFTGKTAEKVI